MTVSSTAVVHPNVRLGEGVVIEDSCIVGYPPKGTAPGELATVIGDGTVIRSHSVIYAGVTIGAHCHVAHHSVIRESTTIGDGSSVGVNVVIEHHCTIGRNVRLQAQSGLAEYTIVEDDAWIGPRVVTANVFHPTCSRAKECLAGPIIRRGAIIGGHAFISPNIEIGANSFVSAGSVVVRSVDEGTQVFGVPARKVGTTAQMKCPYDMVEGSPYVSGTSDVTAPAKVPLMNLKTQNQSLKQELRIAVDTVIFNNRFISGKEVREFEAAFAQFCGTAHAVGVSCGTSAVELALRAVGVGPGDEVITTPHTFIATAEAIVATGATPVFVDVDDATGNIDPRLIPAAISPRTRAILPVHLYGRMADMRAICNIARAHKLPVVEDAAQAHGASLDGKGPGKWGAAAAFSFFPAKNLGAFGDAGGVVTDDPEVQRRVAAYRDHGRAEKYVSATVGAGDRLDTLQAAVLSVKLPKLAGWNEARRKLGAAYLRDLAGLPIAVVEPQEGYVDCYYVFTIRTKERQALQDFLSKAGISTGIYYPIPLHRQPAFAYLNHPAGSFPVAEAWANECLSLPMYPELPEEWRARVAAKLREFFTGR